MNPSAYSPEPDPIRSQPPAGSDEHTDADWTQIRLLEAYLKTH